MHHNFDEIKQPKVAFFLTVANLELEFWIDC